MLRGVALSLVVALLLALAGCQAPGAPRPAGAGGGPLAVSPEETGLDGPASPARPDPAADRLGWESGVWHDEAIAPTLTGTDRRAAVVARAKARVEELRGLEFDGNVSVTVVERSTYRNRTTANHSRALRRFDDEKFAALFLVGDDANSVAVQSNTTAATVQGFYSPGRDAIVVVGAGEGRAVRDEVTLGHELVHALQDQHFSGNYSARTRDAVQGRDGLLEGDATHVQWRYADRCRRDWRCLGRGDAGGTGAGNATESADDATAAGATGNATTDGTDARNATGDGNRPHFGIQFLTYFPYSDGSRFVAARRAAGGQSAVDEAYDDVPDGAPEVIDPSRYPEWEPVAVSLGDRATGDWERVRPPNRPDHAVVGQSAIAAAYAYTLADRYAPDRSVVDPRDVVNVGPDGRLDPVDPFEYDVRGAAGWEGGRLHVYANGSATASVWRTNWTTTGHAALFERRWGDLIEHWGGERLQSAGRVGGQVWVVEDGPFHGAVAVERRGRTVTVTNAPDRAALEVLAP